MKNAVIFLLTIFPLALMGQELDCCKTVKEVETYLEGDWKYISNPNRLSSYKFDGANLILQVYNIDNNGGLEKPKSGKSTVIITKVGKAFKIEYDFGPISTYFKIKYLDAQKLILVRRDGKESELQKIIE